MLLQLDGATSPTPEWLLVPVHKRSMGKDVECQGLRVQWLTSLFDLEVPSNLRLLHALPISRAWSLLDVARRVKSAVCLLPR